MSDPQDWSPEEQALHRALNEAADEVVPAAGGIAAIRERTSRAAWWRRPALVGIGVASATAVGVVAVALVVTQPDGGAPVGVATTTSEAPATTTPSPTATPTPDEPTDETDSTPPSTSLPPSGTADPEPAEPTSLPVYFAVETTPGQPRLVREWHQVETAEPIADALREMVSEPLDPDYGTLWDSSTEVLSAEVREDVIVVELDAAGLSTESPDADAMAIQQLVYTATAAASAAEEGEGALPVQILENDETITTLGSVDVSGTQSRSDDLEVRHLVRVDEPLEGSTVSNPVSVSGEAAVFEASLEWDVRDSAGEVIESDLAATEVGQEFSAFSFELPDLDPGTYDLEVRATDPSGGEGEPPPLDTKTFTVTE